MFLLKFTGLHVLVSRLILLQNTPQQSLIIKSHLYVYDTRDLSFEVVCMLFLRSVYPLVLMLQRNHHVLNVLCIHVLYYCYVTTTGSIGINLRSGLFVVLKLFLPS